MRTTSVDPATIPASELMTTQVVHLNQMDTMSRAAMVFKQQRITGAPVCNDFGHCVGVLSVTDFVHNGPAAQAHPINEDLVGHHMTSPVVSVAPSATLADVALIMCQKHIHRLPVVDESDALVGMISSLDLVAALI